MRPAVVVQADFLNGLIDDTILVMITGKKHGIPDTEVETGSGLTKVCVVSCFNILTRDQALIDQTIGYLSPSTMQQIADGLKKVLELP
jgi:mRNA-degrading endonuclease toxin of MazEF toxin-antitoxin module